MERASTVSIKLARALAVVVFAACTYRAALSPVTRAEAESFNQSIGVPFEAMVRHYSPANDVLYTLLAKAVLAGLQLAEWTLRLPALLGAVLYLWGVMRLSCRIFGTGLLFFVAVAALVLHPLVIDCLWQARGYGLALVFWTWSLVLLLEYDSPSQLNRAGVTLGLSAAAHLSFIFPAIGLIGVRRRFTHLAIPAVITAFMLLVLPLSHADAAAVPATGGVLLRGWRLLAIPLLLAAIWSRERVGMWMAGTAAISCVLLLVWRKLSGMPYPEGPSAVFWIPVLTLSGLAVVRKLNRRWLTAAVLLVPAWYAVRFPVQMPSRAPRDLAKALRRDAGLEPVRIAASSSVAPALQFYRTRYGQWNWTIEEGQPGKGAYNYVVFGPEDAANSEGPGLRILFRSGGLVLAR